MKITSINPNGGNVTLGTYRKEDKLNNQWSLVDLNTGKEVVIVRTYYPASTCYACVWTFGALGYSNGRGKAGGYGYCKESAAIDAALRSAGVELSESISGRGMTAIRDALEAMAHKAGLRSRFTIIKANG